MNAHRLSEIEPRRKVWDNGQVVAAPRTPELATRTALTLVKKSHFFLKSVIFSIKKTRHPAKTIHGILGDWYRAAEKAES